MKLVSEAGSTTGLRSNLGPRSECNATFQLKTFRGRHGRHASRKHSKWRATKQDKPQPEYLSDFISFQSEEGAAPDDQPQKSKDNTEEVVKSATIALEAARLSLEKRQESSPSRPSNSVFTYASNRDQVKADAKDAKSQQRTSSRDTRASLADALADLQDANADEARNQGSGLQIESSPSREVRETVSRNTNLPPWARESMQSRPSEPRLQKQEDKEPARPQLDFAEPSTGSFEFISQAAKDLQSSKSAVLPPFQSVVELTTAAAPPQRGEEQTITGTSVSSAGRAMEDGEGSLQDGTTFKRESGESKGANGYWYRWTKLSGMSPAGQVEWEEKWWEASDWAGMKEMGAEKSGCRGDGAAWRETWREAIGFDADSGEPMVERTAHKWAQDAAGDEWEEKWGEHYWSKGKAQKWADKWGKEGSNVWHEKWGEDYPPGGDACFKYTDKWAEKALDGGAVEQWGDKWEEDFAHGKGLKKGETWSVDGSGHRYQRWWGETHSGDGWVRKHGNSTTGESWDVSEQMDTYYNPIPHFDYRLALDHSPTLKQVPMLPRAGEDIGEGVGSL